MEVSLLGHRYDEEEGSSKRQRVGPRADDDYLRIKAKPSFCGSLLVVSDWSIFDNYYLH